MMGLQGLMVEGMQLIMAVAGMVAGILPAT